MNTSVGNKIRKIRELKNLKQDYLAEQLGISVTAYGNIERGEADVSMERLEQIAKVLDLSIQDILSFDEKKVFNVMHNQTVQNANIDTIVAIHYHEFSEQLKKLYEDNSKLLQDKIQLLEELNENLKKEIDRLKK